MKKLLLLAFSIIPFFCFSQGSLSQAAAQQYTVINDNAFIDRDDLRIFNLFEKFYQETLNSDKGEMSAKTVDEIKTIMADNNFPNRNLLEILLMYQDQLRLMAERNEKPNSSFQILTTDVLATQSEKIYGKVPVLIQIYKGETFMVAYMDDKAQSIFKEILVTNTDCIPARVYNCILTKDKAEKKRLLDALKKERPNHWMVKQFLK